MMLVLFDEHGIGSNLYTIMTTHDVMLYAVKALLKVSSLVYLIMFVFELHMSISLVGFRWD